MFKGYWSRLRRYRRRLNSKSRVILFLCLAICYVFSPATQASTSISIEKIKQLEQNYNGDIQKRFRSWANLIESLKNKPVNVQLEKVNLFFNLFAFQSDKQSLGIEDYWKSPDEFIIDGGGDCDDFAIIKYFTLITLDVPIERLRITYVNSLTLHKAHMVLAYYPTPEAEPLILDSIESKILKASKRSDLIPVYSFNAEGLWLAKQRGQDSLRGQPNSISKWDELLKRMQ